MSIILEALQQDFIDKQDPELEENNTTANLDGGLGQPRTPFAFQSKPKSTKDKIKQGKLKRSVPYTKADKTNLWFKKIESVIREAENPCWKGYKQLGMKIKDGKKVPNCVKESVINEEQEGGMYISYLESIIDYCEYLLDTMKSSDDVPAWIQDKIVIAHHNLEASSNYYDIEAQSNNFTEGRTTMKFDSEYKDFFRKALDRERKSLSSMSDAEKKRFFNKVDAQWKAKNESYRPTKKCCKG